MAFAGAAAAEVKVAGDARMGITYDESRADEASIENRVRIRFDASGTTDGGLEWSAAARFNVNSGRQNMCIDTDSDGSCTDETAANTTGSSGAFNELGVTISGAFGSLTFGSESSAAEYAVGDLAGVGYGPLLTKNETSFLVGARALHSITTGNLTFYTSFGQIGSDDMSVAAKFSRDALTLGIGYEDDGNETQITASGQYKMGDATVKAVYGTNDDADADQYGVSVTYKTGATTLKGFYRVTDTAGVERDFYGIGADYALGGGATLGAGFMSDDGNTEAAIGVKFSF